MSDQNDVILLKIEISEEDASKKMADLVAIKARLTKELKDLKREQQAGVITAQEYKKSYEAITTQLKATDAQIKGTKKTLSDYAAVTQQAEQNINKMQLGIRATNAVWQTHQASTTSVKKRIEELNAELKAEDAIIKATASSMDKLDDVAGELEAAYRGLNKVQRENPEVGGKVLSTLADINREQEKNQRTMDNSRKGIKEYIRDMNILGINVGSTIDSFKAGQQGVLTFAKGIFSARGALVALTAVPVVLVLSAIIAFFKSTDEGADKLEQGIGFLTAAFDSLVKGIAPVGKLFVDLFTSPIETVKKLVKGTDEYSVSLTGVASAAYRAGQAQADYVKTMQDIEDAENALIVTRAKVGLQVDQALLKVKDRSLSEKQRIAILNQAGKAEASLATKTQKNAQDTYDAIVKLNNEFKTTRKLRDDEQLAEDKAQAALIETQRESLNTQQSIQNRRSALLEQDAAEQKAAAERAKEYAVKRAQAAVDEAENALILAQRKGEETVSIEKEILARQIKLIQARADAEKVAVEKGKGAAERRKLIQTKADTEILEATKQAVLKSAEIIYNAKNNEINSTLALTRKGTKEELDLRLEGIEAARVKEQAAIKQRIDQNDALFKAKRITEDQYKEANVNLQIEIGNAANAAAKAASDARMEFAKSEINRLADLKEKEIQIQLDTSDQLLEDERKAARERIALEADTQQKLLEVEKQYNQISQEDYEKRQKAIDAKKLAANAALNKSIAQANKDNDIAILEAQLAAARDGSAKQLEITLKLLKEKRAKAIEAAKGDRKAIEAINKDFDNQETAAVGKRYKSLQDTIIEIAGLALGTLNGMIDASAARQTAALDDYYSAMLNSAALSAEGREKIERDYAKEKERIDREAGARKKKTATAENFLNGIVAGIKAFAELGPIAGAIASAFIAATVIANQIKIDNTKYARGGIVDTGGPAFGPSHAQGGIPMYNRRGQQIGEFEGEETILVKGVYRNPTLRAKASALNVEGGGRAFASGGPVLKPLFNLSGPRYSLGGHVPSYQFAHTVSANIDAAAIASAVIQGVKAANIRIGVDAITQMQKEVKQAEVSADTKPMVRRDDRY